MTTFTAVLSLKDKLQEISWIVRKHRKVTDYFKRFTNQIKAIISILPVCIWICKLNLVIVLLASFITWTLYYIKIFSVPWIALSRVLACWHSTLFSSPPVFSQFLGLAHFWVNSVEFLKCQFFLLTKKSEEETCGTFFFDMLYFLTKILVWWR